DLLHGAARDCVDPLGEDAVGLACEALDREVELAAEPAGRFLSCGADRRLELLRGRLRVPGRLLRDRSPQRSDVLPADLGKPFSPALPGVGLLALDAALELALPCAETLLDLVERLPPLGRVLLELDRALVHERLRRPLGVLAGARDRDPVL